MSFRPHYRCASTIVAYLYNNRTSNLLDIIRAMFLDDEGRLAFRKLHHRKAILKTFEHSSTDPLAPSEFHSCCNYYKLCPDYKTDHIMELNMGMHGHLSPYPLLLKTIPYAAETSILIIGACFDHGFGRREFLNTLADMADVATDFTLLSATKMYDCNNDQTYSYNNLKDIKLRHGDQEEPRIAPHLIIYKGIDARDHVVKLYLPFYVLVQKLKNYEKFRSRGPRTPDKLETLSLTCILRHHIKAEYEIVRKYPLWHLQCQ